MNNVCVLSSACALGQQFEQLMKDNKKVIEKKADNLKAKMKQKAATSAVQCDTRALTLQDGENKLELPDGAAAAMKKLFLVAVMESSWTWDFNAFPCVGLPMVIAGIGGRSVCRFVHLDELKKVGLTNLASLSTFAQAADDPNFLAALPGKLTHVDTGDVIWVPKGFVPFVSCHVSDEDESKDDDSKEVRKSTLLVVPVLHKNSGNLSTAAAQDLKQYGETCLTANTESKVWQHWSAAITEFLGSE